MTTTTRAATYTPRPGSKAAEAHMHLRAHGELSTAALADALDTDSGYINSMLAVPVSYGYIQRVKRNGITWWRVGDGVPIAPDEPDDDPPVQRIVPFNGVASAPVAATQDRQARHMAQCKPAQAPASAAPGLRIGLFSDGSLVLEQDGQTMTLQRAQTEQLVAYLERLTYATEGAAA